MSDKDKKYVCGFCITSHHDQCRKQVSYENIELVCTCFCGSIEYSDSFRDQLIEDYYGR